MRGEPARVRRLRLIALIGLLWIAAPLACRPAAPDGVVLISIDTLRADRLGSYGNARDTSPEIDRLAARGTLFERAGSPAPWTLPAHASLLTGRYPARHGVISDGHYLDDRVPTLAGILAARGFATAAIVNNAYLSPRFGLQRGFDRYDEVAETHSAEGAAREITDRAVRWLETRGGAPFLLFVHYNDVHSDYRSRAEFEAMFGGRTGEQDGSTASLLELAHDLRLPAAGEATRLLDLYDAGIRQLDTDMAPLLELLAEDRFRAVRVVITSDHGEEFLEHGGVLHGATLYDEVLRVPLILAGPGFDSGARVPDPVSLVDVVPTLLAALGLERPDGCDGRDLGAAGDPARLLFAGATSGEPADRKAAVWRARYKYIHDRPTGYRELFDLERDRLEQSNLVFADPPPVLDELSVALQQFDAGRVEGPTAPPASPELLERLRALGYVGGGP